MYTSTCPSPLHFDCKQAPPLCHLAHLFIVILVIMKITIVNDNESAIPKPFCNHKIVNDSVRHNTCIG